MTQPFRCRFKALAADPWHFHLSILVKLAVPSSLFDLARLPNLTIETPDEVPDPTLSVAEFKVDWIQA